MNTTFPELEAAVPDAAAVAPLEPAGLLDVVMVRTGVVLVVVPFVVPLPTVAVMVGDAPEETSAVAPVVAATNQSIFYREKMPNREGRKGNG